MANQLEPPGGLSADAALLEFSDPAVLEKWENAALSVPPIEVVPLRWTVWQRS